jgi:hypothetical protein
MTLTPKQQVKRFLLTGDHDVQPLGWGGDWITSGKKADQAMRQALIEEVLHRAKGLSPATIPAMDHHAFTRNKVAPMVNGLFPETERENILVMLEKSVVFLTDESIVNVLQHVHWPRTAWNLANLYLLSIGGKPLGKKASKIVGLSEETTCYVSHEYFLHQSRFADFVVHEAAHVFHNCKRFTVGLPETRTKEFLLNIDFHQRETFAYACEVYSRMLELTDSRTERMSLLQEIRDEFVPPDDHVDMDRFQRALAAAASATNGWKKILQTCAPLKQTKRLATNS